MIQPSQRSPKPAPNAAFVHPHASPAGPETQPTGKNIHGSKHHPQRFCEATKPRSPHIPLDPSASPSFHPFQGVFIPRRASVFFSGRKGSLRLLWSVDCQMREPIEGPRHAFTHSFFPVISCSNRPFGINSTPLPSTASEKRQDGACPGTIRDRSLALSCRRGKVSRL